MVSSLCTVEFFISTFFTERAKEVVLTGRRTERSETCLLDTCNRNPFCVGSCGIEIGMSLWRL
jgi:hypothetical protein